MHALVGAVLIAAVSTLGDSVWAGLGLRHRVPYGLAHGALLFLCIGAYLGSIERQPLRGAIAGALIGLLAAGGFYALAPIAGYSVMFGVWAFIWLALAILTGRVLPAFARSTTNGLRRGKPHYTWSWRETITRGTLAMIGSGVGFYLISGIWRPFDPQGWDYAVHWISWTVAYLPGFAALLFRSSN